MYRLLRYGTVLGSHILLYFNIVRLTCNVTRRSETTSCSKIMIISLSMSYVLKALTV